MTFTGHLQFFNAHRPLHTRTGATVNITLMRCSKMYVPNWTLDSQFYLSRSVIKPSKVVK